MQLGKGDILACLHLTVSGRSLSQLWESQQIQRLLYVKNEALWLKLVTVVLKQIFQQVVWGGSFVGSISRRMGNINREVATNVEKDDIALELGVKQQKEGVRSQRNCIRYWQSLVRYRGKKLGKLKELLRNRKWWEGEREREREWKKGW